MTMDMLKQKATHSRMGLTAVVVSLLCVVGPCGYAQQQLTWDQVKAKFEAANPSLKADQAAVEELRDSEVTAFLRPNPTVGLSTDGIQVAPHTLPDLGTHWQPLAGAQLVPTISYLHERQHKRELRLESAKEGTRIGQSQHEDLDRNMLFALRTAFIQALQAKAVLTLAKDSLEYYDKIIDISNTRFSAGDIAKVDLQRIELQRVQYEAQLEGATASLRTAKIQLLQLMDDHTPVDRFDIDGAFDFNDSLGEVEQYRQAALTVRPDLQAAMQTVLQAQTNHKLAIANGSTDPTWSTWYSYNPSFNNNFAKYSLGLSVTIPLRIFDRNQGEKQRTLDDIEKNRQLVEVNRLQVFGDVDSAYEQVRANVALLRPYKSKYLGQSVSVRDTVTYSYQHGGASLMDFLNAQSDYRQVQLTYLQLIGTYLTSAAQLNMAVGREELR